MRSAAGRIAIACTLWVASCGAGVGSAQTATEGSSMSVGASADGSGGGPGSETAADTTGAGGPIPPDGSWHGRPPLAGGPRQDVGVAALEGEIFVVGGLALGGGPVARVEAYDPASDTWRSTADVPVASVHNANVAAVGGRLWILGYLTGLTFDAVGEAWVYDPAADAWAAMEPMPAGTERGSAGTAVLGDRVFVVGGLRLSAAVADAWIYDTVADTWTPMPNLPTPRDHLVAAAVGGRIWAIGGRDTDVGAHVPDVDVYDPDAGTWSAGPPMPTSRASMAAGVHDAWIFVAGGEGNAADPSGVFPALEVLDTDAESWASLAPMPTPRHGTGGAVIDGVFHVPGGADEAAVAVVDTHEAWVVGE